MRKLIYIIIISFTIHSCEFRTFPATSEEDKLLQLLFVLNIYLWVNVCPPKDATLDSGTHTITLNEGEEYWFNLSENVEPSVSFDLYYVGIAESSEQTISVGNPSCLHNGQITNPSPRPKAEGEKPDYYENDFGMYLIHLSGRSYLIGIKSTSGSGEIQIKVP